MAAGIVYLDVDDEITSAAARIRSSVSTKVALVVPYGSRIATSRMNFRLLSREALVSNRRLSIVSGDAASRSLAASAGLPVYATVAEYETALEGGPGSGGGGAAATAAAAAATPRESDEDGPAQAATLAESATVAAIGPSEADARSTSTIVSPAASDDTVRMAVPLAAAGAASAGAAASAGSASAATDAAIAPVAAHNVRPRSMTAAQGAAVADAAAAPARRSRAPWIVLLAVVALAVVVLGVAAYLFVPSASIAVTPKRSPISVNLTVSADPDATAVDPAAGVVPAVRLDVPVQASQTFQTTGVHVEESPAHGSVTFTNYDTSSGVSVPSGSIVSTEGGVRFRTQSTVVLQPAAIIPFQPSTGSTQVTAAKAGEAGNVPANTIRVVPQGQNPDLLRVNNPNGTSGGAHTETPEVSKAEVDKAVATLETQLQTEFEDAVASGAGAPPGTKVFPQTAILGPSTPDPDPKTLVGQPIPQFDLAVSATGTVVAVDPSPVQSIAEHQLQAKVDSGHRLVDGSLSVDVGEGTVEEDGQVTFPASARAQVVQIVDPAQLRALVKGKTRAEALAALAPYGDAQVILWPDWVTTITGIDQRLDVTVNDTAAGSPAASGPPSAAPSATRSPAGRSPSSSPVRPSASGAGASSPATASHAPASAAP